MGKKIVYSEMDRNIEKLIKIYLIQNNKRYLKVKDIKELSDKNSIPEYKIRDIYIKIDFNKLFDKKKIREMKEINKNKKQVDYLIKLTSKSNINIPYKLMDLFDLLNDERLYLLIESKSSSDYIKKIYTEGLKEVKKIRKHINYVMGNK